MVIVHQDELESLIAARLRGVKGSSSPLDYLVPGTNEHDEREEDIHRRP